MKSKIANKFRQLLILNSALLTLFTSCSIEKQIGKSAKEDVLDTKALQAAHVGISIFDPAADKYLYRAINISFRPVILNYRLAMQR